MYIYKKSLLHVPLPTSSVTWLCNYSQLIWGVPRWFLQQLGPCSAGSWPWPCSPLAPLPSRLSPPQQLSAGLPGKANLSTLLSQAATAPINNILPGQNPNWRHCRLQTLSDGQKSQISQGN